MNGNYLIPANSKKGQLIFNIFRPEDLIIFSTGVAITLILLMSVRGLSTAGTISLLIPALVATFLVAPIPNYHNVRVLIATVFRFYFSRQKYVWKGWCYREQNKE
mgnify:CR=1 FL=1